MYIVLTNTNIMRQAQDERGTSASKVEIPKIMGH